MKIFKLELLDDDPWVKYQEVEGTWELTIEHGKEPKVEITTQDGTKAYVLRKGFGWSSGFFLVPIELKDEARPFESLLNIRSECEA